MRSSLLHVAIDCEFLKCNGKVLARSVAFVPFLIGNSRAMYPSSLPSRFVSLEPNEVMQLSDLLPCGHRFKSELAEVANQLRLSDAAADKFLFPHWRKLDAYGLPNWKRHGEMLSRLAQPYSALHLPRGVGQVQSIIWKEMANVCNSILAPFENAESSNPLYPKAVFSFTDFMYFYVKCLNGEVEAARNRQEEYALEDWVSNSLFTDTPEAEGLPSSSSDAQEVPSVSLSVNVAEFLQKMSNISHDALLGVEREVRDLSCLPSSWKKRKGKAGIPTIDVQTCPDLINFAESVASMWNDYVEQGATCFWSYSNSDLPVVKETLALLPEFATEVSRPTRGPRTVNRFGGSSKEEAKKAHRYPQLKAGLSSIHVADITQHPTFRLHPQIQEILPRKATPSLVEAVTLVANDEAPRMQYARDFLYEREEVEHMSILDDVISPLVFGASSPYGLSGKGKHEPLWQQIKDAKLCNHNPLWDAFALAVVAKHVIDMH